jgi:hypothetical protein
MQQSTSGFCQHQLFDFDIEVKPILEVLVGKTIEQSLLEVMEEEELANLRQQQREYEEMRNAEKVEQQRLEEQERRLTDEKVRRRSVWLGILYKGIYGNPSNFEAKKNETS